MKPCQVRIIGHLSNMTLQVLTTETLFDAIHSVVAEYAESRLLPYEWSSLPPSISIGYEGIGHAKEFLDAEAKEIADLIVESGINRDQIQIS